MVYIKTLFMKASIWATIAFILITLSREVDAGTIIAYKKGIFGKANPIKERRYNTRPVFERKMPITKNSSIMNASVDMTKNSNVNVSDSYSTKMSTNLPKTTSLANTITTTTPAPTIATQTITSSEVVPPTQAIILEEPTTAATQTTHQHSPKKADNINEHEIILSHDSFEEDPPINTQELEKLLENQMVEDDEALRQYLVLNRLVENMPEAVESLPHIESLINNTLDTVQLHDEQLLSDFIDEAKVHNSGKASKVHEEEEIEELFPLPEPELLIAPRLTITPPTKVSSKKIIKTTTTTERNRPVPCTCAVFLTSQIKRGSNEQPQGTPVITNELDRTFQCNAIGQKQCQTKCLETLVQHLPNSASILCATLNRDCRKERAYLFIKNCRNHWVNTNLAAGREYCCRDGQPYNCPLV